MREIGPPVKLLEWPSDAASASISDNAHLPADIWSFITEEFKDSADLSNLRLAVREANQPAFSKLLRHVRLQVVRKDGYELERLYFLANQKPGSIRQLEIYVRDPTFEPLPEHVLGLLLQLTTQPQLRWLVLCGVSVANGVSIISRLHTKLRRLYLVFSRYPVLGIYYHLFDSLPYIAKPQSPDEDYAALATALIENVEQKLWPSCIHTAWGARVKLPPSIQDVLTEGRVEFHDAR